MNTTTKTSISPSEREQLVQDLLAIQREEWNITIAEWKKSGNVNRAKLRQLEREHWAKVERDVRRSVNEWYPTA